MRCADAVEKITAQHPEAFCTSHKRKLIQRVAKIDQPEVRWHVAQMFSRLMLTPRERRVVVAIWKGLQDRSGIVRTFAMQALADMAMQDVQLRPAILTQVKALTRTGTPAMKSRGKKTHAQLEKS